MELKISELAIYIGLVGGTGKVRDDDDWSRLRRDRGSRSQ